ncbi:MAG: hypothetical protein WAW16_04175 [Candidatus Cryosericum sp.]
MNRKRMRTFVTILIVLALVSGGMVTLISTLRGTTVDEPITMLPGVTLSPQDLQEVGLGTAADVQYAGKTFVFFADSSGSELAGAKNGMIINFHSGSVTFLGGQFSQYSSPTTRDQAYAWYRDKVASTGLADDKGTAVVGDASARYSDPDVAALLVRKNETVFTLLYTLTTAATNDTPRPVIALEALARLLASRF